MRAEFHVAPPSVIARVGTFRCVIDDRDWLDPEFRQAIREESGEERRLERQDAPAIAGRALRKEQDPVPGREALFECRLLVPGLPPFPLDEDGSRAARQPTDSGPAGHFGL